MIGAGPAGLAAAEMLCAAGLQPVIFEAKPSAARKFLMAGKSGLNLTKNEDQAAFLGRIDCPNLKPMLDAFCPSEAMRWAEDLGELLFTGSSRRVFPVVMKGSPLLRRWMTLLQEQGAKLRTRWKWRGWDGDGLVFRTEEGVRVVKAEATVLALGGASWPRLGSDGAWVSAVRAEGATVHPFHPSNMGIEVAWSDHFRDRFAGGPVKNVVIRAVGATAIGDTIVTAKGLEGGALYEVSAALRKAFIDGRTQFSIDLLPDKPKRVVLERLERPRGKNTVANHLRRSLALSGVKAGLLREARRHLPQGMAELADLIKSVPLTVAALRPVEEAISSAGGLAWESVDQDLMLHARPGVFAAGEMLDWDAPTGGYLLTTCIATGRWAGRAAARHLSDQAK
ncbi:MAG: TIGR03862 family flavoprotein [Pseudomonadota bacterium]